MPASIIIAGRYRISDPEKDCIGAGAMGTVYRGQDTVVGRTVAIKALNENVVATDSEIVRRFRREGEALRSLNHPNIIPVYDVIEEDGRHYLVMEYVPGGSLAELLARDSLIVVERAIELGLDLADALTRAHRLGIVHRDLKPANILLADDGPRLVDFGLAHLSGRSSLTASGEVLGTFGYLSPEAIDGQVLDERADIWSLGVILCEMLAGQAPFAGHTTSETLAAILHRPAPLLSQINPDVSDGLADLVGRMLEKERARRIPSARLVGVELEKILTGAEGGPAWLPGDRFVETPEPRLGRRSGHNLPADTTPFVGREEELATLERLLSSEKSRLVTIIGPGGMGKTRLALAEARRQLDAYPDGVYFVSLAALEDAASIVPEIAESLGYPLRDQEDRKSQLLAYLHEKLILLVLDNFEHLLDGGPLLSEILRVAPGVQMLATSRERLGLAEEQLFPIQGLDHPSWETPEDAATYASVQLFLNSACRVRPDFELRPEDLPSLTRICRLAQGMPLAIELAAAWVDTLSPEEIAAEIGCDLDFLETDRQGVPDRQRSIRAVFQYAWRRLAPAEQAALQAFSLFRGGFDRQAAQAVTGASIRIMRRLVASSLLSREPGGRFQLHELMRQFAAEKLATDDSVEQPARDAHSDHYLSLVTSLEPQLFGPGQLRAMAVIDGELENIRAAWRWAAGRGREEPMSAAMNPLFHFYWWREKGQELAQDASLVTDWPEAIEDPGRLLLVATALAWQGLRLPDEEDETLVNRSLELLKHQALVDQDTGWTKAFALERLAAIRTHREMRNLFSLLEEALSLFQLHGDRWWQSEILNSLIYMSRIEGDFIQTRRYTGQLLEIRRELNDPLGSIRTTRTLAWLAQQDGRWEEAERLVRKVFALRLETGQIKQEVDAYMDLGWDLITVGGFKEARPALIRALEGWRNLGVIFREYLTKIHLAYALLFSGHYDEARDLAQEAADFYNRAEYIHLYCRSSNALACVALAQDRYEEAQQIFQETAQAYRKVEALLQESTSHALLSLAYSLLERPLLARKPLRKSLEGSVSSESYEVVGFILAAAALYALADGRIERAVSLYAAARQVPLVARSPWFDEVIGQRIEKRAGELPAQVVERARAQGGSADLWAVARELAEEFEALSGDSTSVP